MQIRRLFDPRVIRGNHERLAVDDETHVTDEALIQNGVDRFAVILAAVGESLTFGARRGREGLGHARRLGSALWWRCARRVLIRRRRCGPNARVIWFRRRVRGRGGWLL